MKKYFLSFLAFFHFSNFYILRKETIKKEKEWKI